VDRQRSFWLSKANNKGPFSEGSSQTSSRSSEGGKEAFARSSSYGHRSSDNVGYPTPAPIGSPPVPGRVSAAEWLQYFPDSSVNERSPLPEIAASGLVAPGDILNLLKLYFDHINPYFSILDPGLHTPTRLFWHHQFLLTIVCTAAARIDGHYYDIYPALLEVGRTTAGNALVQGKKSVADCQAFLLCGVYQATKKKWEDQRGWLYMGIAFTLAQELNLGNTNPEPGMSEREHLNRIRTWLNCYCVDWSHATQFGKPAMISVDDFTARSCREWYRSSSYSLAIDVHLVAYVEILRTMGHFKKEMARPSLCIEEILNATFIYCDRLEALSKEWSERFADHPQADAWMCHYRSDLNRMINAYNRLVVLSYGFQKAVAAKGVSREDRIVRMCIETAKEVIQGMTKKLYGHTGMLRYSMDAHLLFVTFAAGFLLNLLNPRFAVLLFPDEADSIIYSVVDLVKVLQSDQVKLTERHAPALYARYLTKQLKRVSPGALSLLELPMADSCLGSGQKPATDSKQWATQDSNELWTDAFAPEASTQALNGSAPSTSANGQYYHLGGFDMDFSLPYFVEMVADQSKPSPPPQDSAEMWWQGAFPVAHSTPCQWPMAQFES